VRIDEVFSEFYRTEFAAVYRATYLLCDDTEVARDATQEAFARALERWRRLRDQPWAAGWVTTTALNVARRTKRRRHENLAIGEPDMREPGPDSALIWTAIRALPRRQQEAIVLHHMSDLPVEEVGRLMKCSVNTVKTHLIRGRAALREQFLEVGDA
jgi:RNA polymerase sigma-70 factor (ECF subfamily)